MPDTQTDLAAMVTAGFTSLVGLQVDLVGPDEVTARLPVSPVVCDAEGRLHPGAVSTVVETLASVGAAMWLGERGQVVGVTNTTDFLLTPGSGELTAVATPVARQEQTQLWAVVLRDADGAVVADGKVRLQNLLGRR